MSDTSADLRAAVANLTVRERRALHAELVNSAKRWQSALPGVAAVWSAMADVTAEIDAHERARIAG